MQLITFLKTLLQKNTARTPLGRWSIETCNKRINSRIDLANEDHCGPCGVTHMKKNVVYVHKVLKKKK